MEFLGNPTTIYHMMCRCRTKRLAWNWEGDPNRLFLICFDSLLFFSDKSASIKQLMLAFGLWRRERDPDLSE